MKITAAKRCFAWVLTLATWACWAGPFGMFGALVGCGGSAFKGNSTDAGTVNGADGSLIGSIFAPNDAGSATSGCDGTKDPKTDSCVLNEAFGVFVANADAGVGAGTRASPFSSVSYALSHLAGKSRIYVCNGTYTDTLDVTSPVSIYGGLSCGGGVWQWTGSVPHVMAPETQDAGVMVYPLSVKNVSGPVVIEDMAFASPNAVGQMSDGSGASSVAALLDSSTVSLTRTLLSAGQGARGADGVTGVREVDGGISPTNFVPPVTVAVPLSYAPAGEAGPDAGSIVCAYTDGAGVHDQSTGGVGATADAPADGGGAGGPGSSVPPAAFIAGVTPAGQDGLGSPYVDGPPGDPGEDGIARPGGAAASNAGVLTSSGWRPSAGGDGPAGQPGQGGGGGSTDATYNGSFAGGAGGAGGCGGPGGTGGAGGGASIALIAIGGAVNLSACSLIATAGGSGGNGGSGQPGQLGGSGGSAFGGGSGTVGGPGGAGAAGSGGAGGSAGISVAILYSPGALPMYNIADSSLTAGLAGAPGIGGNAGTGTAAVGLAGSPGFVDPHSSSPTLLVPYAP